MIEPHGGTLVSKMANPKQEVELRAMLSQGQMPLPEFTRPEVAAVLMEGQGR